MPNPGAPPPLANIIPLLLLVLIFYFLLIRPQQKQQKEHQKMIQSLKKNDQVVTAGGIYGTVVNVKESTFIMRIDENVRCEVEKSAISRILKASLEEAPK
jgi:preprotein translocase subunit YajC